MFDVIVIGAGLSGLQAAYSAQQAGLSVVVVEARDRVGGKVWSVPLASGRGFADLGAAWVNENTQKRIGSYTKRFNLNLEKQRTQGTAVMQVAKGERLEFPFGITPDVSEQGFFGRIGLPQPLTIGIWCRFFSVHSTGKEQLRVNP